MKRANFSRRNALCCMSNRLVRSSRVYNVLVLLISFLSLPLNTLRAQQSIIPESAVTESIYDQIPVEVIVAGFDNFTVDAIYYTKGRMLCVNIEDLFRTLKIPYHIANEGNSITGFIGNESHTYSIDLATQQIKTGTTLIPAKNRLVKEMGSLYLESSLFPKAFGITLTFNYRTLSMILKSNFELPVMKIQRNEKMRKNISKMKGEILADTTIRRSYHLLKIGTLDWSASSTQSWNFQTYNQLGIGIGTELLFGEADLSINLYDRQKFNINQLNYLWRWVDNDKRFIKQAQAGKLSTSAISFISAPVVGATVRNSPTTVRKATGYYNINDRTEPNWTVELYINNVLVDYTTSDATGLYVFKVPIVYGYTTLKLKFYGPLGEERMEERTMNVPYTVMPVHGFEYGVTGGMVQDSLLSRYGKADFNYGVSRFLTIGGGVEYLSSIPNAHYIPFVSLTLQPFSKMTLHAEYDHGVKMRGLLNYYITKDALLEVDYSRYVEGQLATSFNALEERKVKFSFPIKLKKLNGYAKLDYSQMVYKTLNYNMADMVFSAYYNQLNANISTQMTWTNPTSAYISTDLSISCRLKKGFTLRPSAEYILSEKQLMSYGMVIEKYIPKGNFSLSYKRTVLSNDHTLTLSLKYDLRFAKTNLASTYSGGQVYTSESAQGSLAFGSGRGRIHTSNNSSMGKGGISFYPFLDLNQNGIFDKGEPMVKLNSLRIAGASPEFSKKDSIVRVSDLNAFTSYMVEFNSNELNNIAWRFKQNTYKILIDPNQYKRVDIPILSVGEISGMVYLNKNNASKGIGRILVKVYKKGSPLAAAEVLTESDGYIYFLGLEPGEYIARIDSEQLKVLNMVSLPTQLPVTIKRSVSGDIVDGITFTMSPRIENPLKAEKPDKRNELASLVSGLYNSTDTNFTQNVKTYTVSNERVVMQAGAFKSITNAFRTSERLSKITGKPTIVVYDHKLHKVFVSGYTSRKEMNRIAPKLLKLDCPFFFIPADRVTLSLQIGTFESKKAAWAAMKKWSKATGKPAYLIFNKNGSFNIFIPHLTGAADIELLINTDKKLSE